MNIAYVRVSTTDQNEERQVLKMRELGVEERFIFIDKQSGKDMDRPGYKTMRGVLREGDLLYIDSIDRLGRNYDNVISEWHFLTKQIGADIVALDMPDLFDSRKFKAQGDVGKLLETQILSLLAWVAEQERKKMKQRQLEGIALAKAAGHYKGGKEKDPRNFDVCYKDYIEKNLTKGQFAEALRVSRTTLNKILERKGLAQFKPE